MAKLTVIGISNEMKVIYLRKLFKKTNKIFSSETSRLEEQALLGSRFELSAWNKNTLNGLQHLFEFTEVVFQAQA